MLLTTFKINKKALTPHRNRKATVPRHKLKPRWKKGESGNPKGHSKARRETGLAIKEARQLTAQGYNDLMNFILHATEDQLRAVCKDPNESCLRKTAAGTMLNACKNKIYGPVDDFVSRLLGRIPQRTEMVRTSPYDGMSLQELELEQQKLLLENQRTKKRLEETAMKNARDVTETIIGEES